MNILILIIFGVLGAVSTYYASERFDISAVRSSAILSLVIGLFFYLFPNLLNTFLTNNIPLVFFGTSFIGMVSPQINMGYKRLTIAGAIFPLLFIFKSDFFEGFGGALGALAFISLLATLGFSELIMNKRNILRSIIYIKNKVNK